MERLLIIGCGDVATRALPQLVRKYRVSALVRDAEAAATLRGLGVSVLEGDLDRPATLRGLAADRVLHAAPPANAGATDIRTRNLLREMLARHVVYLSTSAVYGDCRGELVDESRAPCPANDRGHRRLDAEYALTAWSSERQASLTVLRVPGIYAADRLPLVRLRSGAPVLRSEEDVYTNHIHADDLAATCVVALERDDVAGTFNACDDTEMKAGDWLDLVAERFGIARPARVSRAEAQAALSPVQLSFLSESRRLVNRRLKERLGVVLQYPTVREGVPRAVLAA